MRFLNNTVLKNDIFVNILHYFYVNFTLNYDFGDENIYFFVPINKVTLHSFDCVIQYNATEIKIRVI